jgi:hypothetical protein
MAALFAALLTFELWWLSKFFSNSRATDMGARATDMGALARIALGSAFSPLFWGVAVSLFALFFMAGRLSSKPLRIILFWTPVTAIWTLGFAIAALFTYMWLHFRQG